MWVRSEDTGQGLGTQQETAQMGCLFSLWSPSFWEPDDILHFGALSDSKYNRGDFRSVRLMGKDWLFLAAGH